MSVMTGAGTRVFIGSKLTAALSGVDATDLAAMKAAGITYTEIGELVSVGDYGDSVSDVSYTALAKSRVTHLKGVSDGGTTDLTIAFDAGDAGQDALIAASRDRAGFYYLYPIKIQYVDGLTDYLAVTVQGVRKQPGSGNDVVQRVVTVAANSPVLEDPGV
ncbi:hypothetical protein ACFOJE_01670 [Azotobacter bryophylli]|uniref:Phage tail protein n=1 Tax=Azotobacter bryophylli TaxID=1986537 RepID=A0ABV7ANE6_9GAMM